MPTPDLYSAGGPDSPGPAAVMPDEEMAFPEAPVAPEVEEEEAEGEGGEGLKNHLYLPETFPMDKPPKEGDKKDFLVNAEYVKDANGEMCWKELTVDGVPISEDATPEEPAQSPEQQPDMSAEAEGSDQSQMPAMASTPNDVTKMILG